MSSHALRPLRPAARAATSRRPTSRSPTARRCSARWRRAGARCTTTSTRPTRARRSTRCCTLGAGVEDEGGGDARHPRRRPARRAGGHRRAARRGQLRHAAAPAARAGSPGSSAASGRSTATSRSAAARSTGWWSRCAPWAPTVEARDGRLPPLTVRGAELLGIDYELPVASAQVKSCVLIAGMLADGAHHDHRARARAATTPSGSCAGLAGAVRARRPDHRPSPRSTSSSSTRSWFPGDPSSAAFIVAAACARAGLARGARGRRPQLDPRRASSASPQRMGAVIARRPGGAGHERRRASRSGELDVALSARSRAPRSSRDEVPLAIDELTLVALLGAFAEGETVVRGAGELRVKESDRIAGRSSRACAASAPTSRRPATASWCAATARRCEGGTIDARGDHRMAMLGAVAGLASHRWRGGRGHGGRGGLLPGLRVATSAGLLAQVASARWSWLSTVPRGRARAPSRARSRRLGFTYLDSGAMYRAVGLIAAREGGAASERAEELELELGERVVANGEDVTEAHPRPRGHARPPRKVATNPKVREALVAKQRELLSRGRLGGRGPRHRHGGRARRRGEGLPHRERRGARPAPGGRAGHRRGDRPARPGAARRPGPRARALAAARRRRRGRAGHHAASTWTRWWSASPRWCPTHGDR